MAAKSKKITSQEIISLFMDDALENEKFPKSVYKFCKAHKISEADFYLFFASMPALQSGVWISFFSQAIALMEENDEYASFSNKDKMLTFFFTFFELLTLNRSYVLFALEEEDNMLKNVEQLRGLRRGIKGFAKELIEEGNLTKNLKITKHNPTIFSEGAWLQFIFLLRFWMRDDSPGFEKTDVAIEKSVNTIFDVFDNTPLENLLDFGKFLYKETFA
jgi:hypothetical protein